MKYDETIQCFFEKKSVECMDRRVQIRTNDGARFRYHGVTLARFNPSFWVLVQPYQFGDGLIDRFAIVLINKIVQEYSKIHNIPFEPIEIPRNSVVKQGKRMTYSSNALAIYPFFKGISVQVIDDIQPMVDNLNGVAHHNPEIDFLTRSVKNEDYLEYIPLDRLKHFEGNPYDQALREKYAMSGKPIKVLKKAYYFDAKAGEKFLERFRIPKPTFIMVTPDKIGDIYNLPYEKMDFRNTLKSSCMKNKPKEYFDFYTKNTHGILCAYDDKTDKLLGRAIIWKLKYKGEKITLMDRVYTGDHIYEASFFSYALKNGWFRKTEQSHTSNMKITTPQGEEINDELAFKDPKTTEFMPYFDTFRFMSAEKDKMTNSKDVAKSWTTGYYSCSSTDGTPKDHTRIMVYSKLHGIDINQREAVDCGEYGWVHNSGARQIYPSFTWVPNHVSTIQNREGQHILASEVVIYQDHYYHTSDIVEINGKPYPIDLTVLDDITGETILTRSSAVIGDIITHKRNAEKQSDGTYTLKQIAA